MKNTINYFYNLFPNSINKYSNIYYFNIDSIKYVFRPYDRTIQEEKAILDLNKKINNIYEYYKIVVNKDNSILTGVDGKVYILLEVKNYENLDEKINLESISNFSNISVYYDKILVRGDWTKLLSEKIDYLEYQLAYIGKKYPLLVDSFSYYVGIAENAISYIKNIKLLFNEDYSDNYVVSHRRICKNVFCLYDPLNIIIDHKSRDIAEYIKLSFFTNNIDIFSELDKYFSKNYYSTYGIGLLFGRVLYPEFYFDMYDDIINGELDEKKILLIVGKSDEYEAYLEKIYLYLKKYYDIPYIEWLKKRINLN